MSHTPGPWKHIGGWAVYSQDDRPLARAACAFAADCLRESSEDERWNAESAIPDSEAESNARLIAAAPEMAELLAKLADDLEDVFVAHGLGELEHLGPVGIADDLGDAFAIAQVYENDAAVIATAMIPAAEGDDLVDVAGVELAAVVGTHGGSDDESQCRQYGTARRRGGIIRSARVRRG